MVLSGIACLVAYGLHRKALLVSFLVPVICCSVLVPALLYPALDVARGGRQESMGPLFQQTAAFFNTWPNEVSEKEYAVVSHVLKPDVFAEVYNDTSVDPIKATYRAEADAGDLMDYLAVWATQGLRHPLTYLNATGKVCSGFFIPSSVITHYGYTFRADQNTLFSEKYGERINVEKPPGLEQINNQVQQVYYDAIDNSILLGFLFSNALWASWVPFACLLCAFVFRKQTLVVFVPAVVVILFLVITPTILSRYMLPLLYTTPLMLGMAIYSYKTRGEKLKAQTR